jgi:hypothetical protein
VFNDLPGVFPFAVRMEDDDTACFGPLFNAQENVFG